MITLSPCRGGLDFETYCEVSIKDVGLFNYVNHPSFRPLLAYIEDDLGSHGYVLTEEKQKEAFREKLWTFRAYELSAHNSAFEEEVVFNLFQRRMTIRDSAVTSRRLGGSSSLENAAQQLLTDDVKLMGGQALIKEFCMGDFPDLTEERRQEYDWQLFERYCAQDARLALLLSRLDGGELEDREQRYAMVTREMNRTGWKVDMEAVQRFTEQRDRNIDAELMYFRSRYDPDGKLNFNSPLQLGHWFRELGIKTTSFDEAHVADLLAKLHALPDRTDNVVTAIATLHTKQELGGSGLKKLDVITRTVSHDDVLRGQYMHVGAGQTYRTTGVGVQMQNLKRLPRVLMDVDLFKSFKGRIVSNAELGSNLRQLFQTRHEGGVIAVGDYSSVESRGLAYLAGAEWKLEAFRAGKDMYKVLAERIYHQAYDDIAKDSPERAGGKLAELACGYGAGPVAVKDYGGRMGMVLAQPEATSLVRDWRDTNPEIVALWKKLDDLLREAVNSPAGATTRVELGNRLYLEITTSPSVIASPHLVKGRPGLVDLHLTMHYLDLLVGFRTVMRRVFRGVYTRGTKICYHKPISTGALWSDTIRDPKTKKLIYHSVYGGKLAGILTQSFCRELFFNSLMHVRDFAAAAGVQLVGQFHDEIALDVPRRESLSTFLSNFEVAMTQVPHWAPDFPLAADIKYDKRYIK